MGISEQNKSREKKKYASGIWIAWEREGVITLYVYFSKYTLQIGVPKVEARNISVTFQSIVSVKRLGTNFSMYYNKRKLRFLTTWQRCKWMENEFPLINFLTGISLIKLFYCFLMGITLSPSALPLLEMITDGTLLTSSVDVWNYLKLTEWLWGNWWIARVEKAT